MNSQHSKSALVFALFLASATGCEETVPTDTTAPNRGPVPDSNMTTPAERPGSMNNPAPRPDPMTTPAGNPAPAPTDPRLVPPAPGEPRPTTPAQPAGAERDREITQEVRAMIRHDSAISALAESIDIQTASGVVTLRGRVASQEEKDTIGARVRQVPGVLSINNELEVDR